MKLHKAICPKCGKKFEKEIKHNHIPKFCSRKCANSRERPQEVKDKISNSVRQHLQDKGITPKPRKTKNAPKKPKKPPQAKFTITKSKNPKRTGNTSEMAVVSELVKMHIPVLIPVGDNEPYDLVFDINGKLHKAQVKTARLQKNGSISISLKRTHFHRGKEGIIPYTKEEIDFVFAFCPDNGEIYMFDDFENKTAIYLRVDPPKNGQTSNIRMAKDYLISNFFTLTN